jgi:hypothetical protein
MVEMPTQLLILPFAILTLAHSLHSLKYTINKGEYKLYFAGKLTLIIVIL